VKLFGVIDNESEEGQKIWLIQAGTIEETIENFKEAEKERGWNVDSYEFSIAQDPYRWGGIAKEGDFTVWEIEFDENGISFNDWS
jgi:hypothetical protein